MPSWLLSLHNRHFFLLDVLLLSSVPALALVVRLNDFNEPVLPYTVPLLMYTGLALAIKLPVFRRAGLYARYWRYASADELGQIALAVSLASVLFNALFFLILVPIAGIMPAIPRSLSLLDFLLTMLVVGGPRYAVRLAEQNRHRSLGIKAENPVLVIGAGDAGRLIVREMQTNPRIGLVPVGFVDDDPSKQGLRIHDVPVLGKSDRIAEIAQDYRISQAIIAMPTAPGKTIRQIFAICEQAGLTVRTVPGIFEILGGQVTVNQIRNVQIEDLLRREPVQIDAAAVRALLNQRRVLVTGAGGSIGSELCRQIAQCDPAELVLLGHGEHSIFHLASEFSQTYPHLLISRVIADVRDRERMDKVFARFRPEIVFHAAAHKHVPLMEENAEDAVTNNVLGTRNVVQVASSHEVERLVLISTDKAVNPTSIMGTTKRVAELIVCQEAERSKRNYVSVRFGNVLGSRGSVVNVFREQIARGGPVTVTHPEMCRYFMTIPEAVQLVLQAATLGAGGEVFVLDMGEPVKIVDMAKDLIELSGLQVGRDIDIEFTGIRPGEKLFEELFLENDKYTHTEHEKIFVSRNGLSSSEDAESEILNQQVDALIAAARSGNPQTVCDWLERIVPEYQAVAQASPRTTGRDSQSTADDAQI